MKNIKYLIFTILFLTAKFSLFAGENHNYNAKFINRNIITEHDILLSKEQIVYICTGTYAYAYHSKSDCPGLNNCKGQINYTDEYSAVNSLGRKPCCRCWSNVSSNCKDDNPAYGGGAGGGGSGGGGSGGEAYAFLALVVVATGAVILSNDMYLYPAISFFNPPKNNNQYGQQTTTRIGTGWLFGFRKTFKHSALEYGISYFKFESKYNYGYGYTRTINQNRQGGHFNFVHQIFYNNTPEWLKVYFGPSINYVFNFGYGGIVGAELKIFDRLKFDFRYELTTQTNQIQTGLIFTYQKKYFWQKNR